MGFRGRLYLKTELWFQNFPLFILQTKFQYFAEQLNLPIPQRDTASLLPPAVPLDELEKRTYRDSLKANALNEL